MNFIKKHFLKKYIAERKVVRNVEVVSLQKAKRIGILCNITEESTYKDIYAVFSSLQSVNRTVWLVGYVDDKLVPFYCIQQLSADFFCNKDLNWYGKPEKVQINDFINTEFDLLLDFTHQPIGVIQLILALSHARFIVGSENENAQYYDLFINCNSEIENRDLLKHITHYTQQLLGE